MRQHTRTQGRPVIYDLKCFVVKRPMTCTTGSYYPLELHTTRGRSCPAGYLIELGTDCAYCTGRTDCAN